MAHEVGSYWLELEEALEITQSNKGKSKEDTPTKQALQKTDASGPLLPNT